MAARLLVTRSSPTLEEIRARERGEKRVAIARRLTMIRLVAEGALTNVQIAGVCRCHVNRVAVWVRRFNELGFDGLLNEPKKPKPSVLSAKEKETVRGWVRAGGDPKKDGFAVWTAPRLAAAVRKRLGNERVTVRIIYRLLYASDFRHRKAGKVPAKADPKELAAWGKKISQ